MSASSAPPRRFIRDGVDSSRFGGPDVERRVADVGRLAQRGAEAFDGCEDRVGRRLVALGVVGRDHDLEVRLQPG